MIHPRRTDLCVLAKTEIRQLHMAMLVEEDIVGFEIAMYVIHLVHSLDRQDSLSDVEATFFFR